MVVYGPGTYRVRDHRGRLTGILIVCGNSGAWYHWSIAVRHANQAGVNPPPPPTGENPIHVRWLGQSKVWAATSQELRILGVSERV